MGQKLREKEKIYDDKGKKISYLQVVIDKWHNDAFWKTEIVLLCTKINLYQDTFLYLVQCSRCKLYLKKEKKNKNKTKNKKQIKRNFFLNFAQSFIYRDVNR